MRLLAVAILAVVTLVAVLLGGEYVRTERTLAISPTEVIRTTSTEITIESPERVPFVYQSTDGQAFRAMVERTKAEVFVRTFSRQIEERKQLARQQVATNIDTLFARAFHDRDASVTAYADWFYTWGRPYQLVSGALGAASAELAGSTLSSVWNLEMRIEHERIHSVAQGHIQDRLLDNYTIHVLKPQHRDPIIEQGVRDIVTKAYDQFLADLDSLNLELVEFLYAQDPNAQSIDSSEIVDIDLVWDTARFDGPRDRAGEVIGAATVGATVLIGSAVFSAEISAILLPIVSTIGSELLTTVGFAATGGVLGSEVPVIGNVIGLLAGLSADYVINRFREKMTREDFEAETHRGIQTAIDRWKGKITPEVVRMNDIWYADVRRWMIPEDVAALVEG